MIDAVLIRRYRTLRDVCFAPQRLTLITGANGTGKSSLYRALTLLQRAATPVAEECDAPVATAVMPTGVWR